jgi:recombination DNA repair RAD52 pathway protein
MLRFSLFLLCMIALPVQAEQLYKCIGADKEVTYSNLPCSKFPGMKEAKTIEPDPGPPVQEPAKPAAKEKAAKEPEIQKSKKTAKEKAETKRVLKAERAEKNKCDKISEQISEVMDKMDAARHQGYTPKQESEWNQKIKELTAKKNRLNCF